MNFDSGLKWFTFLTVLFLFSSAAPAQVSEKKEQADKPGTESPLSQSRANIRESGDMTIEYTVYVPVIETRLIREGMEERMVTVTRVIPERRAIVIAQGKFRAIDASGKPIEDEVLRKKLAKTTDVHVWRPKNPPMLNQLKSVKKDGVILILDTPLPGRSRRVVPVP